MIEVRIDQEELKALYLQKVEERIREIEETTFYFSSKELCRYLGISWNTIVNHLLIDEAFPRLRLGNRYLFPVSDVKRYMEKYTRDVMSNSGDILQHHKSEK